MTAPPPEASRQRNIILFGETGAGKSAVINLLAGSDVARTSPDLTACTLQSTKYPLMLESGNAPMSLHIWDTIGLEEPDRDPLKAIENAYKLIKDLHAAGGVDLLLFCIRGGRITVPMQRHYKLFFDFLCNKHVPLAIVVTHLETEEVMEDWWSRNEATLSGYEMCSVAHACITAVSARLSAYASRRAESRITLRDMLYQTLTDVRTTYTEEVQAWYTRLWQMLMEFFTGGKKRGLVRRLRTECAFRPEDAERIAAMILARQS